MQIDEYLARGGSDFFALRGTIRGDPLLEEMARSPLMLNVIALALRYDAAEGPEGPHGDTVETRRAFLFERYIQRMFARGGRAPAAFPEERLRHWLGWLAGRMRSHSLTIFLIENFQPGWLPTVRDRWVYALASRLGGTVLWFTISWLLTLLIMPGSRQWIAAGAAFTAIGSLSAGTLAGLLAGHRLTVPLREHGPWARRAIFAGTILLFWFCIGLVFALFAGPFFVPLERFLMSGVAVAATATLTDAQLGYWAGSHYGTIFGLVFALRQAKRHAAHDILLVDTLRVNWKAVRQSAVRALLVAAALALVFVLIWLFITPAFFASTPAWRIGYILPVVWIALSGILAIPCVCVSALFSLFTPGDLPARTEPGRWLKASAQNALLAGLVTGVAYGCLITLAMLAGQTPLAVQSGLMAGAGMGLAATMWYGGFDVIQHLVLRFLLRRRGCIPAQFIAFLDHAARLIFLQKVGPGYIFMHRQLLEHFAASPVRRKP